MDVSLDWLTEPVENAPTSYEADLPDRVALKTRMAWQKLKSHMHAGDELWAFANPPATWRKLGKRTGFALVRQGAVIEAVVTSRE
jgi:hypothetical protein